jgi:hypothetical protein
MEQYLDKVFDLDEEDGIFVKYNRDQYEKGFLKYIENFHDISLPKFKTPRYNKDGEFMYYYMTNELIFSLFTNKSYVKHVIETIKSSENIFSIINCSLYPVIDMNGSKKNETTINTWNAHSILVIYIKKDDIFYIIDTDNIDGIYTYYEYARYMFFNRFIVIEETNILQCLEYKAKNYEGEFDGYCVAWSYLFANLFLLSYDGNINKILNLILYKCESNPTKLRKLIRNFTFLCL